MEDAVGSIYDSPMTQEPAVWREGPGTQVLADNHVEDENKESFDTMVRCYER